MTAEAEALTWHSTPTAARLSPEQEGPARTQAAYEPVSLSTNCRDELERSLNTPLSATQQILAHKLRGHYRD
ncbi:hypothetical protein M413DRAFT_30040 [Hebeloma cylindrosporum]|uniref:Uncharacterized protein n=1 Tax=Hebeloma cylindrosporum TaxID=76867 RepID=A0A0C3BP84_HEBCY|nr:hypothetical protein M413DRAFT_31200 [Hebeloma cylindrosporum h7]KIM38490.1 hypothetical protein M413DRAFT_30040 [Hebeloma cylindrosporum h7]